jgi:hypothetical protein
VQKFDGNRPIGQRRGVRCAHRDEVTPRTR